VKIRIGDTIRVPSGTAARDCCDSITIDALTTRRFPARADPVPGIFAWAEARSPSGPRRPAITLFSNPFVENRRETPWVDYIDPERGYARYYGDAKNISDSAITGGNAILWKELPRYHGGPEERMRAAPVLVFRQVSRCNARYGHREFCGYGVPTRLEVVSQPEPGTGHAFTNLRVELALFSLTKEDEGFDWDWVDDRRDPSLTHEEANTRAPSAWKRWVEAGQGSIPLLRRQVHRYRIATREQQLPATAMDERVLRELYQAFRAEPREFEFAAMWFAARALGSAFSPGWVTKRSGDGGYDFVGRLDFERQFGPRGLVVIGEAKLRPPQQGLPAGALARLAARIQRGWVGVFVTTATYQAAAQREVSEDAYPLVLLNGSDLAQQVRQFAAEAGIRDTREAIEKVRQLAGDQFDVADVRRDPNEVLW